MAAVIPNLPGDLVDQFARGNGVVFVGAGVSKGAGLPDWSQLISNLVLELGDHPASSDFRDLAQYYEIEYGRHRLITRIREQLESFDAVPTKVHQAIVKLPIDILITTNYDDLLEQALRARRRIFSLVVRSVDAGFWSADRLQLIKLHGDLSQAESVVVTSRDYERHGLVQRSIVRLVSTILQTRTVLFLGYSVTDPDLRQILTEVHEEAGSHSRNLYSVQLQASPLAVKDLEVRGVKVINLSSGSQPANDMLERWLNDLAAAVSRRTGPTPDAQPAIPAPRQRLSDEVVGFLQVAGYTVGELSENVSGTDFVATRRIGGTTIRRWFRCIDGSVGSGQVQSVADLVEADPAAEGWIITYRSGLVTRQARDKVAAVPRVRVLSLPEFYREVLGLVGYLERLLADFDHSDVGRYWVDLACEVPQFDGRRSVRISSDTFDSVETFLAAWLDTPGRNHISILGEFGTGKTWLCEHFTAHLAKKYLADCEHNRVPILVSLKGYPRLPEIRELVTDTLVNKYGVDLPRGYETFDYLNRHDSLVLIFDGFDEMQMKVDDSVASRNFEELAKVVVPGANCKVLLTCRGSYFRTDIEARTLLGGDDSDRIRLRDRPNFEILELLQFETDQIKEAVRLRSPDDWPEIYDRIGRVYDLPDLARRPILLSMIVETFNEANSEDTGRRVTPALLYQHYTEKWINKNLAEERTFMDAASKRYFMQELAWAMFARQTSTIAYVEFPEAVREYFSLDSTGDVDYFEHDIRTQSFLQRSPLGLYSYAHKSFMDFFIAQRITEEIAAGDSGKLASAQTSHETDQFVRDFVAERPSSAAVLVDWMRTGESPVLRVNSAGILAKIDDPRLADEVVAVLVSDGQVRGLYLTAVLARVLDIDWSAAVRLAAEADGVPAVVALPADQLGRLVERFSREVGNPRDAAARWLSTVLLGHVRDVAPATVEEAVGAARRRERSTRVRTEMDRVLAAAQ